MNIFIEDMVKYGKHKLDYNSLETTTKNGLGYGTPNVDRFFQYGESIYDTDNERFRIHEFSSICIGPGGFYARTYHDIRVVQTTISVENFKNSEIIKIFIKILEYSRNTFFEYCNNEILQLFEEYDIIRSHLISYIKNFEHGYNLSLISAIKTKKITLHCVSYILGYFIPPEILTGIFLKLSKTCYVLYANVDVNEKEE